MSEQTILERGRIMLVEARYAAAQAQQEEEAQAHTRRDTDLLAYQQDILPHLPDWAAPYVDWDWPDANVYSELGWEHDIYIDFPGCLPVLIETIRTSSGNATSWLPGAVKYPERYKFIVPKPYMIDFYEYGEDDPYKHGLNYQADYGATGVNVLELALALAEEGQAKADEIDAYYKERWQAHQLRKDSEKATAKPALTRAQILIGAIDDYVLSKITETNSPPGDDVPF